MYFVTDDARTWRLDTCTVFYYYYFLIYIKDLFICLFNVNFNDKIICKKKLSDKMNNSIS